MAEIISLEIAAMVDRSTRSADGTKDYIFIRPVLQNETPNLWTVLGRDKAGRAQVLKDCRSASDASHFTRRFRRKLREAEQRCGLTPINRPIKFPNTKGTIK